jgi:serine/threonine-protein kinase
MAPEQAMCTTVDHRADLHALATITYRALVGRPAFGGESVVETLYQIVHTMPPRPSSLVKLHAAVDDVLHVAMAKDPGDRFGTGEELAAALEGASRGEVSADVAAHARRLEAKQPWGKSASAPA